MSNQATGLDPIENAVLMTLHRMGVGPGSPFRNTKLVLDDVNERYSYAPHDTLARILALSRPWLTNLRLTEFHGNPGTRSYDAADPRYTKIRLTKLGADCAQALAASGPAIPTGLIMGDTYKGGRRPPLDPRRMVAGLRIARNSGDDAEIIARVGPPQFPSGCSVHGAIDSLNQGAPARLRLTARVTPIDQRTVRITHLPPDSSVIEVHNRIRQLAYDVPIAAIDDESTGAHTEILVRMKSPNSAHEIIEPIRNIWGVHRIVDCQYPKSLAELVRTWVHDHARDLSGLDLLESD